MPTDVERTTSQQVLGAKQRKMKQDRDAPQITGLELIQRHLNLTRAVMPALARTQSVARPRSATASDNHACGDLLVDRRAKRTRLAG